VNTNGERPDDGPARSMAVGWVAFASTRCRGDKEKNQDRARGIQKMIEYRENHELPCVEHYIWITARTLRWRGQILAMVKCHEEIISWGA